MNKKFTYIERPAYSYVDMEKLRIFNDFIDREKTSINFLAFEIKFLKIARNYIKSSKGNNSYS